MNSTRFKCLIIDHFVLSSYLITYREGIYNIKIKFES